SSNNKIIKNTADGNSWFGIGVTYGSNNNSIFYNTLTNNGHEGIGLYRQSNYNKIYNNNASNNVFGVYVWDESNYNSLQCNVFNENEYGLFITNSSFNANFNTIVNNVNYGIIKKGTGTVNATNNWWGRSPVVASTVGSDIYVESGIVNFNPWFTSNIGFTSDQIINASLYVKNYIESNHQLPSSVNISGIQVNMPQFLKLAAQSVVNADSGLDDLIVLGDYGAVPGHVENMTDDELDSEYVSIADEILDYMDLNRNVPSNISNTSLGDTMSFESLVYMYSRILGYYSCDNNTLPDSISINPWIAVSNPNKVYNFRTQKVFNSIQSAIDDVDTIADDVISLWDGNYLENVIVNKTVTIESLDDNVTVNALNTSLPVFTINTLGSGSIIQNICINGSLTNSGIYINNSFNNTIFKNLITSNGNGIRIYNSTDNEISSNLISNNTLNGIFVYLGGNNTIYCNNLTYNGNGIVLNNSINNTIRINLLSKNLLDGIGIVDSSAVVSFNVISQNGRYGLYNQGNSTVDAQNNWWGSNNPSMSANGPSDIYNSSGTLNCDKWIVMNVNSTCDRSNRTGACYNYVITADLTHNNQGNDTSDDGNIPDGMPVTFVTNVGTISNGYTRNGKSVSNLNSSAAGLADVSVTLNNQTNNITVNVTSINIMGIYNNRTHEGFTTIQNAINDNDTLNGDIITLNDGIYTENVVVNKTVFIKSSEGNIVTVTGYDPDLPIFTINYSGKGSTINGLTLFESENSYGIFLNNTNNCNITGNDIFHNLYGVYIVNSNSTNLVGNDIFHNLYGVYIVNSNSTLINGFNNIICNGFGINYINSNNTLIDEGNNVTKNSVRDLLQIDTAGIVMADTSYNCGPAALATVIKNLGFNVTLDELSDPSEITQNGISIYDMIQLANEKGLIAKGVNLTINNLKQDNIVYLIINGEGHFSVIKNITNGIVYLADPSLGNIEMDLDEFEIIFSGKTVIITTDNNNTQFNGVTYLTDDEMKISIGKYDGRGKLTVIGTYKKKCTRWDIRWFQFKKRLVYYYAIYYKYKEYQWDWGGYTYSHDSKPYKYGPWLRLI
ncbi:MAG: cysteine peptidase family C39 domain-containing protein, partial [Rubrivivax sp.]|nr:cysteine peptidase family C39 domain-containing protein [Rubrivivax sp.]